MPLVDPLTQVEKQSNLTGNSGQKKFRARVLSNKDPRMLGRLKCQIQELLPFEDPKQLPWVYPQYSAGQGAGATNTNFAVPEEDTFVTVEFPYNSQYFGFYTGAMMDNQTRSVDFCSEYPERSVSTDSVGNKTIVNKSPRVNSIDQQFADGGFKTTSMEQSRDYYKDPHGTMYQIDRKNQRATVLFGGVKITIGDGTIKLEAEKIIFSASVLFNLMCKSLLSFAAKTVNTIADTVTQSSKNDYNE